TPEFSTHSILPDGTSNIVYCRTNTFTWLKGVGPRVSALEVPVFPDASYWGVRLIPHLGAKFIDLPELKRDQIIDLNDLTLQAELDKCSSADEAYAAFWQVLRRRFANRQGIDSNVGGAVRMIFASNGDIGVGELAPRGVGIRQLQRLFKQRT